MEKRTLAELEFRIAEATQAMMAAASRAKEAEAGERNLLELAKLRKADALREWATWSRYRARRAELDEELAAAARASTFWEKAEAAAEANSGLPSGWRLDPKAGPVRRQP